MPSVHKLVACIPAGDPDLEAEVDCEITFSFTKGAPEKGPSYASGGQPADPHEIEFVSAMRLVNGKPAPYDGAYAYWEQKGLDALASDWLESEAGEEVACEQVYDDECSAREHAEEMRAEMRRED